MYNFTDNKKYDIVDISRYDYSKEGGDITLKFSNGKVMRRKFYNTSYDYARICSLSGTQIKPKEVCIRVTIKERGYGQYIIKNTVVQQALEGGFKVVDESNTLVVELRKFLDDCSKQKTEMIKRDRELRAALREIKFNSSKVGVKMSKANQLLEVLSK